MIILDIKHTKVVIKLFTTMVIWKLENWFQILLSLPPANVDPLVWKSPAISMHTEIKPQIHQTKYCAWQNYIQMENCG